MLYLLFHTDLINETFLKLKLKQIDSNSVTSEVELAWNLISTNVNFEKVSEIILSLTMRIANYLINTLIEFLINLPLDSLIIFAAWWILLTYLFSAAINTNIQQKSKEYLLVFSTSSLDTKHNLSIFIVLMIGVYLSIGSIAAVPWLQGDESSSVLTADQLRQNMNRISLTESDFNIHYPENPISEDIFEKLNTILSKFNEKTESLNVVYPSNDGLYEIAKYNSERIQQIINSAQDKQKLSLKNWQELRNSIRDQQATDFAAVIGEFEANEKRSMSREERAVYYLALTSWSRAYIESKKSLLYDGFSKIKYYNDELSRLANLISIQLEKQLSVVEQAMSIFSMKTDDKTNVEDKRSQIEKIIWKLQFYYPYETRNSFYQESFVQNYYNPPAPPEPGASWGPFSLTAGWLLKTRSLNLALVTGMLGFGLVGSAVSQFVRQKTRKLSSDNTLLEVFEVVIRGLSAAMVIFLAVKGGLAVFSAGNSSPNAYVLYLTCFLGAVYSEDVWDAARKKFKKQLEEDENKEQ